MINMAVFNIATSKERRKFTPAQGAGVGGGRSLCGGWLTLEILLATALCVALTSAGVITMYQVIGMNKGLYPASQLEQVELSRLLLEIERDFYNADRAYVFDSNVQEQVSGTWGALQSVTHLVSVINSGSDQEIWPLSIGPSADSTFLANWVAHGSQTAALVTNAVRSVAGGSPSPKYYTLVFLKGFSSINAVVYLTVAQTGSGNTAGVTYTLTRYEGDGSKLWEGNSFTYTALGANMTNGSDQSATNNVFPSFARDGATNGVSIRFPTAFSTALKDVGTGKQSGRVKYTADAWGNWVFAPGNFTRWN